MFEHYLELDQNSKRQKKSHFSICCMRAITATFTGCWCSLYSIWGHTHTHTHTHPDASTISEIMKRRLQMKTFFCSCSVDWMAASLCLLPPVYLFVGLMMMFLLLRTIHKMADLHGLTSFLQLPPCEVDLDDDRKPIVEDRHEAFLTEKEDMRPLEPGSQPSYNTINTSWAVGGGRDDEGKRKKLHLTSRLVAESELLSSFVAFVFFTQVLLFMFHVCTSRGKHLHTVDRTVQPYVRASVGLHHLTSSSWAWMITTAVKWHRSGKA